MSGSETEFSANVRTQFNSFQFIKPGLLGKWIIERFEIWQMDWLDAGKLARFAKERGPDSFSAKDITQLWQLGLLRADLVVSPRKLRLVGLIHVRTDKQGRHMYADERQPPRRTKGWGSTVAKLKPLPSRMELYFHPFRYYVLYHLIRILKSYIHPMQMLWPIERYPEALSGFQEWSSKPEFLNRIHPWNSITALAVTTEPCTYESLFSTLRYPSHLDLETQRRRIKKHWSEVSKIYQKIGIDQIERIRQDLCVGAELLDPNKDLHIMLRLTRGKSRLELKGTLGGAICLLTMAEMLRRAAERVFEIKLREEDELGFGMTFSGMKEKFYGSNRILDSNRSVANQFLRQFGLDYGVRIRWYIEGDTEYNALDTVLPNSAIELINLRGRVAERGGKGLAFRDSLRNDIKAQIFSLVSIDGDRSDYLRAVRRAAEDDEICGMFFVSKPDFEFHNFKLSELEGILWEIAKENGAISDARQKLHDAIKDAKSKTELKKGAKNALPELCQFDTGKMWGQKLMEFAWNNPEMTDKTNESTETRPIVKAVDIAIHSVRANYRQTRVQFRVDPASGKLVKRSTKIETKKH